MSAPLAGVVDRLTAEEHLRALACANSAEDFYGWLAGPGWQTVADAVAEAAEAQRVATVRMVQACNPLARGHEQVASLVSTAYDHLASA